MTNNNIYEQLVANADFKRLYGDLSENDKKAIDQFAKNISGYADNMLNTAAKGMGNTTITQEELSRVIRDKTGAA